QGVVFCLQPLVFVPQGVVTDPAGLCARDGLYHALSMHVDRGTTIATVVRPPRHCSPSATEDGGSIANPGLNRYIQHGSEPPRSKLGQTWFIDDEAHLLQSRVIVNSNSSKNRYSGTIPETKSECSVKWLIPQG